MKEQIAPDILQLIFGVPLFMTVPVCITVEGIGHIAETIDSHFIKAIRVSSER